MVVCDYVSDVRRLAVLAAVVRRRGVGSIRTSRTDPINRPAMSWYGWHPFQLAQLRDVSLSFSSMLWDDGAISLSAVSSSAGRGPGNLAAKNNPSSKSIYMGMRSMTMDNTSGGLSNAEAMAQIRKA